jgi:sugar/nucleoside kinase (ribokinase family)
LSGHGSESFLKYGCLLHFVRLHKFSDTLTKRIEAIDSTGAGDNFLAAFLVARKKGLSVRKALAVGNIVSGQVIQHKGARLPMSLNVPKLMQEAMQIAESLYD